MNAVRALALAGVLCLGIAWLWSTPPFGAPDEVAHYLRAAAIADGHLVGSRVPIDPEGAAVLRAGGWQAVQQRWIDHDRRAASVAPRLSPPGATCADDYPDTARPGCPEVSYTGDYHPLPYLLPALALSLSARWQSALWWMRTACLAPALAFLALALWFAARVGASAVAGVLTALTPTVLFISAALNPSGLELTAGLAFLSGLLALMADPDAHGRATWALVTAAGVVTILSWQLGPAFAAIDVVIAGLAGGPVGGGRASPRRRLHAGAAALGVAVVAWAVYGLAAGDLHSHLTLSPLGENLRFGRAMFVSTLTGDVGDFGRYGVPVPVAVVVVWWSACAALTGAALWCATRRERVTILLAALLAVAFPWLFAAFVQRSTGFGLQARYVLPVVFLLPTLSGQVIARRAARRAPGLIAAGAVCVAGAVQLIAWAHDDRHWAHASGPAAAGYRPSLGWAPWTVLATLGAVAIVLAGIAAARQTMTTSARLAPRA